MLKRGRYVNCHWCGSTNMRSSRFRLPDLPRLLRFQYPVRCHACHERTFANLISALRLPRPVSGHHVGRGLEETHRAPRRVELRRSVNCYWCGSINMRTSRFQPQDLLRLLRLQYPVRCRACRERSYRFLLSLRKLPNGEKAHRIERDLGDEPRGM